LDSSAKKIFRKSKQLRQISSNLLDDALWAGGIGRSLSEPGFQAQAPRDFTEITGKRSAF
jgi:hypothetical protein